MSHTIPALRACLVAAILILTAASSPGSDDGTGKTKPPWKLTVRVVDAKGEPVQGARVELYGIDRWSRHPANRGEGGEQPPAADGVWTFMTDAKGECNVQFRNEELRGTDAAGERDVPGFGEYYFVVTKGGFAGGVSRRIENFEPGDEDDGETDEWKNPHRPSMSLASLHPGVPLTITLSRGITITGRIVDTRGRGLDTETILIYYDLHIESHTGYGGEFWWRKITADSGGNFHLNAILPGRFYLESEGHWARTRIDRRWVEGPVDYVDAAPGRNLHLTLVYAANPLHRYSGKIVDEAGKPIPNLRLVIGLSEHWPQEDYRDSHHFEYVTTDANGHYELETDSPFVRFVQPDQPSQYKGPHIDDDKRVTDFDFRFFKSP